MTRANMTPWWPPASRSPPACWRSRCRRSGIQARSWQGWQIPIKTSDAHASARILEIDGAELINRFRERKEVAVIAGFQGINPQTGRITTLGRGGSDTSAVAIAAAIHADRCDIYTDVDGVYTTDPRVVPKARRLDKIAFEDMLELASQGAKVLQVRSVELGMVHNMPIFVRSSFDKPEDIDPHGTPPGTLICSEEEIMETHVVTGIAFSRDEAQISVRQIQDKPGVAASIFGPLAEANINVDMIVQNVSEDGATTDLTFTVPASDYVRARDTITAAKDTIGYQPARQRHRCRQGLGDRQRHAQPCRRRRPGVCRAGRAQHQHPRHHHLGDQIFGADRCRLYRARRAHAAHALWARPGLEESSPHADRAGITGCQLAEWGLRPLAGVLLGKSCLNSLYGLMGGLPQTVPRFWLSRFGRLFRACDGAE